MSRSKIVQVHVGDVDLNMRDIDTDDLLEELEIRKVTHGHTRTDEERGIMTDRFFEQRRRQVTHFPGEATQEERDFWYHVHGRDI